MNVAWRVLDLTETSQPILVRRGGLVIGDQRLPLEDFACILTGETTQWNGELVALAAQHDVVILACDWRGIPISATLPWSPNTRIAARQQAQARLSVPRQKNAWMRVIKAKIQGQANNLWAHSPGGYETLSALAKVVRSGDPANIEARSARTYWSQFMPTERFVRDREQGGRNAQLNYGYAIVRGVTLRAICLSGLTPTLGIWHHNRANPFGLADDLMEPFRPAVEHVVRSLPQGAQLADPQVKAALVASVSMPMCGTGYTVSTCITQLSQDFANYVEGNLPVLAVPAWEPGDG